jgi:hypothetical protein
LKALGPLLGTYGVRDMVNLWKKTDKTIELLVVSKSLVSRLTISTLDIPGSSIQETISALRHCWRLPRRECRSS